MNVVIGMGCDRVTSLQTLETALDQALAEADLQCTAVSALASIDKKRDEAALLALVWNHNWPLH
ncbi:MAG: cobalamin biosynthesis protein [Ketobacter sp.]|nr:cobalamin biosynthesis protein [Ketobacter sp.]